MNSPLRFLILGLALTLPFSEAHAQVSVSAMADRTVNAGGTITVNVVAVDPGDHSITLTSSLPGFATLNAPTTGTGQVVTTLTISPGDGDVGMHSATVTATAGEQTDTEGFQITVNAAESNQPPRVSAPALMTVTEGSPLTFDVTASDPDQDAITTLDASVLPNGASFTANGSFTSGAFSWTPDLTQAGQYDVVFFASNAQSDSATTHISVLQSNLGPVKLKPISDVTVAENDTMSVDVIATDPDKETISLTASLPSFATLEAPTSSSGTDTLGTSITIAPGPGTAGQYTAWVKATSGADAATDTFSITVTGVAGGELQATATLIGHFNTHKKFICFKVKPVDNSFDLRNVSLHSITLSFQGDSISTVRPTHLAFDCDGDDDDEDEDSGSLRSARSGTVASLAAIDHGHGDDDDCDECDGDDDDDGDDGHGDCVPSHIMACFAMGDILDLFEGEDLPASFADATIEGELTTGETFVATIGGKHTHDDGHGHDGDKKEKGKGRMRLQVRPNPMNPKTEIVFTTSQPGPVRVAIYDLQGRLMATLRDGNLPAGAQSIAWDGSTSSNHRAATGIYFVKVQTLQEEVVQQIAILK